MKHFLYAFGHSSPFTWNTIFPLPQDLHLTALSSFKCQLTVSVGRLPSPHPCPTPGPPMTLSHLAPILDKRHLKAMTVSYSSLYAQRFTEADPYLS